MNSCSVRRTVAGRRACLSQSVSDVDTSLELPAARFNLVSCVAVRGGCNPAAVATSRAAILTVGPDCPADFNGDGAVDFFDYLDFVAAFSTEC